MTEKPRYYPTYLFAATAAINELLAERGGLNPLIEKLNFAMEGLTIQLFDQGQSSTRGLTEAYATYNYELKECLTALGGRPALNDRQLTLLIRFGQELQSNRADIELGIGQLKAKGYR